MTEFIGGGDERVSTLVESTVVGVAPDATLHEVADALVEGAIGALIVGSPEAVSAVVSERDLVRALAERRDPGATRALDIANTALIWCDAGASIADVARMMMDRYVRHVLVEQDGELVGIVSARDLLGAFATATGDPGDEAW